MTDKPLFVIGSSGFGGSSFTKYALQQGFSVHGFSRSLPNDDKFLPYTWIDEVSRFEFSQLDLNKNLDDFFMAVRKEKPALIFNFASQSMVGESWKTPEHWMQTNVVSTTSLIQGLANFDFIDKYIHFTTPEVYGSTEGWIKESFDFYPSTPYALSRASGDWIVKMWHDTFGFPAIFTRAANIYGEGQQLYRIIPKTILFALTNKKIPLHGGGKSSRAFAHMDDVSAALMSIIEVGQSGDSFHISPHESVTILELVQKIGAKIGVEDEKLFSIAGDRIGKDSLYLLNSDKLMKQTGWSPKVSLDEGLDRCIGWVQQNIDSLRSATIDYVHKP
ncbi:MAG: GDP-mannose 4,6-dehydratase [Rhodospirillaceae bacterium]|nr:GDP-mannose 4,6-dehydratase [Rhodospirillaceae bacterium]